MYKKPNRFIIVSDNRVKKSEAFMKKMILSAMLVAVLSGCAAYKQLTPEPEVKPEENGYIELKDDQEWFELDAGKKYYIEFPAAPADNFYLVTKSDAGDKISTVLSSAFDADEKGPLSPLPNEAAADAGEQAWPVDDSVQKFYLAIENVREDLPLHLQYRYLPRWRYKFETQAAAFRELLTENTMSRDTYEAIGVSVKTTALPYEKLLNELNSKNGQIRGLQKQLATIEKLFPASIINSSDPAYLDFTRLQEDLEVENTFQENFRKALEALQLEVRTRGSIPAFAGAAPQFNAFLSEKERYPQNISGTLTRAIDARLDELVPYYDDLLRRKKDIEPVDLNTEEITSLYENAGKNIGPDYKNIAAYVTLFNRKAEKHAEARGILDEARQKLQGLKGRPTVKFFSSLAGKAQKALSLLPSAGFGSSPYKKTAAAKKMTSAIHKIYNEALSLKQKYTQAANLVTTLNRLEGQKQYGQMIETINNNPGLSFFKTLYADLDRKSLQRQKGAITSALARQKWAEAEQALRRLYNEKRFINTKKTAPVKKQLVRALEDTLVNRVERFTRRRVDAFVNEKYGTLDNVNALYDNPVFEPVWDITFTSGSKAQLAARKQKLRQRLQKLKEVEFPARAITALYRDFTADVNNNGVARARAIVAHGQHYKGKDRKIKTLVAECDPWASKWLTKTADYRLVYALPTTSNDQGENTYVFRINIRIPTEARFPVYDLNIKLPAEVGQKGGAWYQQMTMNKKVLKPEGRFSIVAPGKSNNYTALVTPLSVEPKGDNVLEVRFKQKGLKVFPVSVMAEKPILRKN